MEQENYFDLWKLLMIAERDYLAARDAHQSANIYSAGSRFDCMMAAKERRDKLEKRLQKLAQDVCRQDSAASRNLAKPAEAARQGSLFG